MKRRNKQGQNAEIYRWLADYTEPKEQTQEDKPQVNLKVGYALATAFYKLKSDLQAGKLTEKEWYEQAIGVCEQFKKMHTKWMLAFLQGLIEVSQRMEKPRSQGNGNERN